MLPHRHLTRIVAGLAFTAILHSPAIRAAPAQTAPPVAATAPANSQRGTIKSIDGNTLTLTTDAGKQLAVTVAPAARILQIAPGSTDLKAAQPIDLTAIAAGDRVLVTGKSSDTPDAFAASRVILMKSTDIAERKAAQQADWQRHGSGGIVSAIDPATGTLTVMNGPRKTQVATSSTTIFRRYAGDSVRFEDAQTGTLTQLQPGDQVRLRGARSGDGSTIQAAEIVSGSFRNLSGTVASVDAAAGTLLLKDLATKKTVTVKVTANSDFRKLPAQAAMMLAMRSRKPDDHSGTPASGTSRSQAALAAAPSDAPTGASRGPASNRPAAGTQDDPSGAATDRPAGRGQGRPPTDSSSPSPAYSRPGVAPGSSTPSGAATAGGASSATAAADIGHAGGNMDLAQMLPRFPASALADLKPGDALMIVASQTQSGAAALTAITMLSGVEPILAASPSGSAPGMTLSPWNVGGGAPGGAEGGGAQ